MENKEFENIIVTEGLCKSFSIGGVQQHVLNNLDLQIADGDFTVIKIGRASCRERVCMFV